jgi:hypothetical protein
LISLLFVAYVNFIWKYIESAIRLLADDGIIYTKIVNSNDLEKLQIDLGTLGD